METETTYEALAQKVDSGLDLTQEEQTLFLTMIRTMSPNKEDKPTTMSDEIRLVKQLPTKPTDSEIRLVSNLK